MELFDKKMAIRSIKRRRKKKIAAIIAAISSTVVAIFIVIAFCLIYIDRFTVSTTSNELTLSIDDNREIWTTELVAPPLLSATDTQYTDIPEDIDEGIGSKNTEKYFAYSFYLGGISESGEDINYSLSMKLTKYSQELEQAIRVLIIRNGARTVYAQADAYGNPEKIKYGETHESKPTIIGETIPFKNNKHIILEPYKISSGEWDKYTIVMWIDGWESVNSMKGGNIQTELKFSTLSTNIYGGN